MEKEQAQEQAQQASINPQYMINSILEDNVRLTEEKARANAINLQLQEENRKFLDYARQLEGKVQELENELKAEKAKHAGPVKKAAAKKDKPETVEK